MYQGFGNGNGNGNGNGGCPPNAYQAGDVGSQQDCIPEDDTMGMFGAGILGADTNAGQYFRNRQVAMTCGNTSGVMQNVDPSQTAFAPTAPTYQSMGPCPTPYPCPQYPQAVPLPIPGGVPVRPPSGFVPQPSSIPFTPSPGGGGGHFGPFVSSRPPAHLGPYPQKGPRPITGLVAGRPVATARTPVVQGLPLRRPVATTGPAPFDPGSSVNGFGAYFTNVHRLGRRNCVDRTMIVKEPGDAYVAVISHAGYTYRYPKQAEGNALSLATSRTSKILDDFRRLVDSSNLPATCSPYDLQAFLDALWHQATGFTTPYFNGFGSPRHGGRHAGYKGTDVDGGGLFDQPGMATDLSSSVPYAPNEGTVELPQGCPPPPTAPCAQPAYQAPSVPAPYQGGPCGGPPGCPPQPGMAFPSVPPAGCAGFGVDLWRHPNYVWPQTYTWRR